MNPNVNPITNPISPNDLVRLIQEGYASLATIAQLSAAMNNGGGVGLKSPGVLAQPGTSQTVTNTAAATVLATINFPALPANGALNARFQTTPTGTGAKTYFAYLNGVQILTAGLNPSVSCMVDIEIFNQNAQNVQANEGRLYSNSGSAARVVGTSAVDLSGASNTLTIAVQLTTSTESCAVNNVRGTFIAP